MSTLHTNASGAFRRRPALMLSAGAAAMLMASPALAQNLPTGGVVAGGNGTAVITSPTTDSMNIAQSSPRAIIDWTSFDIGGGHSVNFDQPAGGIAINRVSGGSFSNISGTLTADGTVMLLNPNGVVFGAGAIVDVGGLVATTRNLTNDVAFMGGANPAFSGATNTAVLINSGATISVADGGLAAFVAPHVQNQGVINARAGRVELAAGDTFTLDLAGDRLLALGVSSDNPLVQNNGQIFAEGGVIRLSAAAASGIVGSIINTGGLEVNSATLTDGVIVLEGGNTVAQLVGAYDGAFQINGALGLAGGIDLRGNDVATINVQTGGAGLIINTGDVTVQGVTFNGPISQPYTAVDWGGTGNSWGIQVTGANYANVNIQDNTFQNLRTGILFAHSGNPAGQFVTGSVTGNVFENTKGGVIVQYRDGSALNISGNTQGAIGNEWGVVYNTNLSPAIIAADAPGARQTFLLDVSNANNGLSVLDRGYTNSNRTHVNVAQGGLGAINNAVGNPREALGSIQAGVNAVVAGGTVLVGDGTYTEAVAIGKANLRLLSVNGRDVTTIQGLANLDTVRISANGVTIGDTGRGFTIIGTDNATPSIERAAVYVSGANSGLTVRGNRITAGGEAGLLTDYGVAVSNLRIDGNIFDGATFVEPDAGSGGQFVGGNVPRNLVYVSGGASGGAEGANKTSIFFTNNQVTATTGAYTSDGVASGNSLVTIDAHGATITGNTFAGSTTVGAQLRARGANTLISGNTFNNAGLGSGGMAFTVRNTIYGAGQDVSTLVAANSFIGRGAWATTAAGNMNSMFANIQGAVNEAAAGATVNVRAGTYTQGFSVTKNLTVQGAGVGQTIIAPTGTMATGVGHKYDSNVNAVVFVNGAANVVLDGLTIDGNGQNNHAGVFWTNASGEIRNSRITNVRPFSGLQTGQGLAVDATSGNTTNLTVSNVLFDTWNKNAIDAVTGQGTGANGGTINLTVTDSTFTGRGATGTIAQNGILLWEQGGGAVNAQIDDSVFSGIEYTGDNATASGVLAYGSTNGSLTIAGSSFNGVQTYIALSGGNTFGADAIGNTFDGVSAGSATLDQLFAIEDRIDHGVDEAGNGLVRILAGNLFVSAEAGNLARAVALASGGDTVRFANGTHSLGASRLIIDKSLTLNGQSEAGAIIDGRGVGGGLGTLAVFADNVSLSNFTLYGADSGVNNFGIKVQPNPSVHSPSQRLNNFSIDSVTVRGSTRAELDLNGVKGASITNFTANGYRVGTTTATGGAGIQITDSQDVTLSDITTLGNDWGSIAIYQTNSPSGYDQLTDNITLNAIGSSFGEQLGVFVQSYSTLHPQIGQLNLNGFTHAVRNTGHRANGAEFTFFRTSFADAAALALGLAAAETSSIEGWTGTGYTNQFTVVNGLSINSAVRDARSGALVNVGAGTYAGLVTVDKSLTLSGAGKDQTILADGLAFSGSLSNIALNNFTVRRDGGVGASVVSNGGAMTNLTMDGVRIDGQDAAGRHGFIGNTINGDISITNSEFLNIDGWAAFDTRSGAGANQGAQITSAVFSNNLIDNTQGHINFRQDATAPLGFPDVVFSNNTVRNVGSATNSFGAVFKAFNADTVTFSGNNVSGVGTSGFNPAGEAAYGAVLMVRGAGQLDIANNIFTDNHMVFAVEPGRDLPTVINLTGNTFTNNAYGLYMPVSATGGAGAVNFGAGNNFVSGASTVQHIVWRGAAGLDLTGVQFNGALASGMSLDQQFAVESLITHGVDVAGAGLARLVNGQIFVEAGAGALLRGVTLASTGDTVNLGNGSHVLTSTLNLNRALTLRGQSQAGAVIDASAVTSYGLLVTGDNVTLADFTLSGPTAALSGTYAIKAQASGPASARMRNFTVTNVAVNGSNRTGLDLNGVVGALIDGVTVTGTPNGNGIAITDSANVTVRNSTTSGNAWGGLALYQRNNAFDQQLTNIVVEANNNFGEANPVYIQAYDSALYEPERIAVAGFDFIAGNPNQGGTSYIWFRRTLQDAIDQAVNAANPDDSVVTGWTGVSPDLNAYVGVGALNGGGARAMSIQNTFDLAPAGYTIHVGAGSYAQSAVLAAARNVRFDGVTLQSLTLANGSAAAGSVTADGNLTFGGLTLLGDLSLTSRVGSIAAGPVSGPYALSATANAGAVTLGALNAGSVTATGATVLTAGATTTGGQFYQGGTVGLSGAYVTLGGGFTVAGLGQLGASTSVQTSGGAIAIDRLDGPFALSLNSGAGLTTLGSLGAAARLGDVQVVAANTVLVGGLYAANSLAFSGAAVHLFEALTTFDTRQSATAGGAITFTADLLGTANGAQSVAFIAGTGALPGDGDITIANAGTDAVRLGAMTVTGGDFSAQTVKLAGDFTSTLSGNQVFSANTLDTLGSVNSTVAGSVSGPINAGGDVTIAAGGDVNTTINAGRTVNIATLGGINSTITTPGNITLTAGQRVVLILNGNIVTVTAPEGTISGVFATLTTNPDGSFIINRQGGFGGLGASQLIIDGFIIPAGGVVGATGVIQLPAGLALGLIAPAGEGDGQRPPVLVNNVETLGELLRRGYTAIIVQIDESGLVIEEELILADAGEGNESAQ